MPWVDVQAVAQKYPWAVIDPSVLIGHSTPTTFDKLADDRIPLWRQYYFDWLIETKQATLGLDKAQKHLQLLNITARSRKESTKVAQRLADQRREAARAALEAAGPIGEFREAIREIKEAIEKYAKESRQAPSAVGLRFAAEAMDLSLPPDMKDDEVLGRGVLHMLSGPLKEDYVSAINDAILAFRRFGELTEGEWSGLDSIENALSKAHANWGAWESELRVTFGGYEGVMDYLLAEPDERSRIRVSDQSHEALYDRADAGELRKDLWAVISRYGQSMIAEWTTVSDCCAALVKWGTADAKKKLRQNFNSAFKEASAGILAAKTAVGVTTTVLAFFPPFGPLAGATLSLCMTVAEIASKEILVWQATNDPEAVISYLGREFRADVPEDQQAELLKNIAEYGAMTLELMEQGTEAVANFTKAGIALSPYVGEAAKLAAEASFHTMESAMPVVGGVITVGVLATEWYKWNDDQKKYLQNSEKLTEEEVSELQGLLRQGFDNQTANVEWHGGLGDAKLLSWTSAAFRVRIKGVEGTIDRTTFRFSPTDRTKVWNTILARAKNNTSVTFRTMPITLDLSNPANISEVESDLSCEVPGTCQNSPCYQETFDFIIKITAEGNVSVTGIKAPTFAETAAKAVTEHQLASPSKESAGSRMTTDLTFLVDWANATQTGTGQWHFDCTAPGVVELFPVGKYRDNTRWDLTLQLPFKGTGHVVRTSEDQVNPIVSASTVQVALKEQYADFFPPPANSIVQSYQPDWDSAEFADFDRARGGFQIKSVSAYDIARDSWNSVQDIWVQWDFEHEKASIDLSNMKETLSISAEKTDELEKIFTEAVTNKKSTRATGKHYKRTLV